MINIYVDSSWSNREISNVTVLIVFELLVNLPTSLWGHTTVLRHIFVVKFARS